MPPAGEQIEVAYSRRWSGLRRESQDRCVGERDVREETLVADGSPGVGKPSPGVARGSGVCGPAHTRADGAAERRSAASDSCSQFAVRARQVVRLSERAHRAIELEE